MTTTVHPDRASAPFTPGVAGASPAERPASPPPSAPPAAGDAWTGRRLALAYGGICLLAFLASFTSLRNGFAYDDIAVVAQNARVHTLHNWWHLFHEAYWPPPVSGGLYRPIVILMYAVLWQVGGGSPFPYHLASVLLYIGCAAAVYRLCRLFLSEPPAWAAAALFAVHPVHTECVANIVGVSEVITGLACALAVGTYIKARRSERGLTPSVMLQLGSLYLLACLSKEHGFFLPGLIGVAELLAVDDPRPWRARLRAVAPTAVMLAVLGAAWLAARNSVPAVVYGARWSAVLGNYPWRVRLFTFLTVVPEWVRLLFWPAHLSVDYSPQQTLVPLQWTGGQAGGVGVVLFVLLGSVLVARVNRRAAFGLAWLGVTLAIPSGLLVATGYLLAERTLFMPSMGAVLLVGFAAQWLWAQSRRQPRVGRALALATAGGLAAAIVAGTWRSAERQPVWKDNATLFVQAVEDAPLSYRVHYTLGVHLLEGGNFHEAEKQLLIAIRLFDADPEPREFLGIQYAVNNFCAPAIPLLRNAMEQRELITQDYIERSRIPRGALVKCFLDAGQYDSAAATARRSLKMDRGDTTALRLLGVAEQKLGRPHATPRPQ